MDQRMHQEGGRIFDAMQTLSAWEVKLHLRTEEVENIETVCSGFS